MSSINCSVSAGYPWVADSQGRTLITRDRLNLAAVPAVTVNLTSKIAAEDLIAESVTAVKLSDAVAQQLLTVVGTVPAEAANNIDVSIQVKDAHGDNRAANVSLQVWLADSGSALTPTATLPSGGAPSIQDSKGFVINPMAASVAGFYMTDATGLLKLRFTETGALTRYLCVAVQGKLVMGDQALIWTS